MLFLGCMSDFTTETDRIFLKAFPWELKMENNVETLLCAAEAPPQLLQGKAPRDLASQKQLAQQAPGDNQHGGDEQVSHS